MRLLLAHSANWLTPPFARQPEVKRKQVEIFDLSASGNARHPAWRLSASEAITLLRDSGAPAFPFLSDASGSRFYERHLF